MPSFQELEKKWGGAAAYHYLLEAEKAAEIPSWKMVGIDPETRFSIVCRIHDLVLAARKTQAA